MFTAIMKKGRIATGVLAIGAVVALAGCSSSNPMATGSSSAADKGTLVVGSQAYYSNEIIAEIYSQALEANGYTVDRQFQIGQREVYLPELESGKIDVFPEYSGSLMQALLKVTPNASVDATASKSDAVYAALVAALPANLKALDKSAASDQNSYTVTQAFAAANNLTTVASLANVTTPIVIGGNSELQTRPYGPDALKSKYGINSTFLAIEDGGGPLTIKALVDNQVQLANVYTADPNIKSNNLVALSDPDGLFVADNVVPIVSTKVNDAAAAILNKVSAALSEADLVSMNAQSVNDQMSASNIAKAWLASKALF